MPQLYNLMIQVQIGTKLIKEHEIEFDVVSTLSSEPDEAIVRIANLSREDRAQLEASKKNTVVTVSAGYENPGPSVLFTGNLRRIHTERQAETTYTIVEAQDSFRVRNPAQRLDKSYRKGTSLKTVINDLVRASGVSRGNINKVLNLSQFSEKYQAPYHASGQAWEQLVSIFESRDFNLTTQNNKILVSPLRQVQSRRTVALLKAGTGLIGTPSVDQDGLLTCEALMVPDIFPGTAIRVESEFVTGDYKVVKTTHKGSLYNSGARLTIEGTAL